MISHGFLCKEGEMVNHLLLRCHGCGGLCAGAFEIVGIKWVMASTIGWELRAQLGICSSKDKKKLVRMIRLLIFWTVWRQKE